MCFRLKEIAAIVERSLRMKVLRSKYCNDATAFMKKFSRIRRKLECVRVTTSAYRRWTRDSIDSFSHLLLKNSFFLVELVLTRSMEYKCSILYSFREYIYRDQRLKRYSISSVQLQVTGAELWKCKLSTDLLRIFIISLIFLTHIYISFHQKNFTNTDLVVTHTLTKLPIRSQSNS